MKKVILLLFVLSLIISCVSDPPDIYDYTSPKNYNDGFEIGTLDEVDIDKALIEKAVNLLYAGKFKEVHSILILKDNKLVFEEYFKGHKFKFDGPGHHGELVTWYKFMLHHIQSVTKSITSICIGIAIDKGFIKSVNQSIFDYLPAHQHLKKNGKEKITIEHLLTMTSGIDWNEWNAPYSSPKNPIIGIWYSEKDPITFILDKPLKKEPGTNFSYFGGNQIILGEIIKNATGMDIDEFSGKYLFEPLGIGTFNWAVKFGNGVIEAAGGLKLTSRDMVKIGMIFLNKGMWNGKRIISEQWVEKSAYPFPGNDNINVPGEDSGRMGYSYSWWTKGLKHSGKKIDMFTASGFGGQHIMVIPALDTVVVFTAGNYVTYRPGFKILEKYIIPAIE